MNGEITSYSSDSVNSVSNPVQPGKKAKGNQKKKKKKMMMRSLTIRVGRGGRAQRRGPMASHVGSPTCKRAERETAAQLHQHPAWRIKRMASTTEQLWAVVSNNMKK